MAQTVPPPPPPVEASSTDVPMSRQPETGLACPMEVPGAKVAVAEVKGETALDFTTNGDVIDLRTRVRGFGVSRHAGAIAPDARVAAKVSFEDLPNGVRVVFTPLDQGQADALRAQIAQQVAPLNQGDCTSLEIEGVQHKANRIPPPR